MFSLHPQCFLIGINDYLQSVSLLVMAVCQLNY